MLSSFIAQLLIVWLVMIITSLLNFVDVSKTSTQYVDKTNVVYAAKIFILSIVFGPLVFIIFIPKFVKTCFDALYVICRHFIDKKRS